jgi:hypothetical protein
VWNGKLMQNGRLVILLGVLTIVLAGIIYDCSISVYNWYTGYPKAIEKVLAMDYRNSKQGGSAADVFRGMQVIDLSECPNDFRMAYSLHASAWEHAAKFQEDAGSWSTQIYLTLSGLTGDRSMPLALEQEALQRKAEIDSTWTAVTHIATKYGVSVTYHE